MRRSNNVMWTRFVGSFLVVISGCEAFTAHVNVVARAGGDELTVNRLAEVLASVPDAPVEREVVELLAWRWVEFSIFAQHAARGDSMLDSAYAVAARWHDVHRALVGRFHEDVIGTRADPTPIQVDSAYQRGELRFISHVLRRAPPEASQAVRAEQRRVAQSVLDDLGAGGSWERANTFNQDTLARQRNGSIGALRRGQVIPQLENAAYSLDGGAMSPVVETRFGYHVIYRPPLADVRQEFTDAVRSDIVARLDSAYEADLVADRDIQVQADAGSLLRSAIASPFASRRSGRAVVRYNGGQFRVQDFVRWMEVLSDDVLERLGNASDAQLIQLARSLTLQEIIRAQADSAGVELTAEQWEAVEADYRARVGAMQDLLTIHPESLAARAPEMAQRLELARLVVDKYLEDALRDTRLLVPLPQGLTDQILEGADWEVDPAGVQRVLQRARQLRQLGPPAMTGADSTNH